MVRRRFAAARASCSSAECTDCVGVDESRVPNRAATPIPAGAALTVVVVASEAPAAVSRLLSGLRFHSPAGTQIVVVANDPSAEQEATLRPDGPDTAPIGQTAPEVLRTSRRLAIGVALNIGLMRAAGDVIVLADGSAWPTGDAQLLPWNVHSSMPCAILQLRLSADSV